MSNATLFLIDKIEGNSNIGVPVFSRQAQRQNFEFLALAPSKKIRHNEQEQKEQLLNPELERFRIASPPKSAVSQPSKNNLRVEGKANSTVVP